MIRFMRTGLKKCMVIFIMSILILGSVSYRAEAATAEPIDPDLETALTSVHDYILERESTPDFDSVWFVIGLARSGLSVPDGYFEQYYSNVIAYCTSCNWKLTNSKYTEYSKMILGMTAIGIDARDVMGHNLLAYLSDFSKVKIQGLSGPIWALLALNANPAYTIPIDGDASEQTTEEGLIDYIMGQECAGGGWSLAGTVGDCDITCMVLQALAPYYHERDDVTEALDRGIEWLSEEQLSDGGFMTYGTENAESIAQVVVALSTLSIDCGQDSRFIKNGHWPLSALFQYYLPEGGFMHVSADSAGNGGAAGGVIDGKGTEQGFYALVSYNRFLNGENTLYDMSDITLSPGTEPTVSSTIGTGTETGSGSQTAGKTSGTGTVRVSGIQLNYDTLTIKVGKTKKLKATVSPSDASNPDLKWTSSDKSVAKVNQKGKVTALKAGTATIKAKATDGSGKKAVCKVTVKKSTSTGSSTAGGGSQPKAASGSSGTSGTTGTASSSGSSSGDSTGTGTLTGAVATAASDEDTGESGQLVAYPASGSGTSTDEDSGWSFTGGDYVADSSVSYHDDDDAYGAEGTDGEEGLSDEEAVNTAQASIPALPGAVGGVSEAVLIGGMFIGFRKHNFVGAIIHGAAKFFRGG